jgi:ABC-2 type transport system ATP-binding protein
MKESLRRRAESGAAIVLSSHLLPLVEELCQRILVIASGKSVAFGSIDEIRARLSSQANAPAGAEGASLEDLFIRITAIGGREGQEER